jgi:hypothetical protein
MANYSDILKTGLDFLISSGIAVGLWKGIETKIKNHKVQKATKALTDMALVYDHLNFVSRELDADRCTLVYTSNGGGIPSAAKNIYYTVLYEVKDNNSESIRSHFQNVLVDEEHTKLLNRMLKETCVCGSPQDLQDSFLKSNYEFQDVKRFCYFEVYKSAERYYYIAINWHDLYRVPDTSTIKAVCQSSANNIKTLLSQG